MRQSILALHHLIPAAPGAVAINYQTYHMPGHLCHRSWAFQCLRPLVQEAMTGMIGGFPSKVVGRIGTMIWEMIWEMKISVLIYMAFFSNPTLPLLSFTTIAEA